MTRVLDALKALESRRQAESQAAPRKVAPPPVPAPMATEPAAPRVAPLEPPRRAAANAVANMCLLPTVPLVADHYQELAESISQQLSTNYCNVLLFVSADDHAEPSFSMTHLAQAFSLQSAGDVLLVDGDLRNGRLSKTVCPPGPGLVEAMQGTANWLETIHPTTTPRIDFVGRGPGALPTTDRPEFGWGALRPKYRAVLIGVADSRLPETALLAAHCDAVYFLISRPHTKREAAGRAVAQLRASGANLLGCIVVND
jgi:Mrp family chromosome partitioning ATPase